MQIKILPFVNKFKNNLSYYKHKYDLSTLQIFHTTNVNITFPQSKHKYIFLTLQILIPPVYRYII